MTTVASPLSALQITREGSLHKSTKAFLCTGVKLSLVCLTLREERPRSTWESVRCSVLWEVLDAVHVYLAMCVLARLRKSEMSASLLNLWRGGVGTNDKPRLKSSISSVVNLRLLMFTTLTGGS